MIATLVIAAAAFAYIVPIVTGVIAGVSSLVAFVGTLSAAIGGATTVMGAISAAIAVLGGPITLIIAAIALLAAAWTTNFGGIRDKTKAVVDWVIKLFGGMSDKFLAILGPIGWVVLAFRHMDVIKDIVDDIISFVTDGFYAMINFLSPLLAKWMNAYIKIFNFLVPYLNKAGAGLNTIAELQFDKLERTVADTASSIEGSTKDISDAIGAVETDIGKSATGAAAAYQGLGDAVTATSDEMTATMAYAGVTRKDLARRAEMIASGVIRPAEMVKSIPNQIGAEPMTGVVNEQKTTNQKLDKLDKLTEISTKLDGLKIEINNYTTNNVSSGGGFSGGGRGSSGTLVGGVKESKKLGDTIPSYKIYTPSYAANFK